MQDVVVRATLPEDHDRVLELADRLAIGTAPWLDPDGVLEAVRGWVSTALAEADSDDRVVLVAETEGVVVGFAGAAVREHWSGELRCYLGELVVADEAEGQGIGSLLVQTVSAWAARRELRVELDTGADNSRARGFYAALGFREEAVRLVAVVEPVADLQPRR
jgi:GNAT superfamily N-acetyltransferase